MAVKTYKKSFYPESYTTIVKQAYKYNIYTISLYLYSYNNEPSSNSMIELIPFNSNSMYKYSGYTGSDGNLSFNVKPGMYEVKINDGQGILLEPSIININSPGITKKSIILSNN
jgi:hypothetical protein